MIDKLLCWLGFHDWEYTQAGWVYRRCIRPGCLIRHTWEHNRWES